MEKSPAIELPIELDAPAVPGFDWDEVHEGYLAKLEREGLLAGDTGSEEERFVAAINEGIASMEKGEMVPLEEVRRRMERKFGVQR
jgi:hypothetical protein